MRTPDFLAQENKLATGSKLWASAYFKQGDLFNEENILQSTKQVEHWLKPFEGREHVKFDYSTKLIDIPNPEKPGDWSKKYATLLENAKDVLHNYDASSAWLKAQYNNASRNRYYWELCMALHNFQTSTPILLLALKNYDLKPKNKRLLSDINKALNYFDSSWKQLQNVYSETRFIQYPDDYIRDRYFHLASQREDLSWMIQAQELFHQKIMKLF